MKNGNGNDDITTLSLDTDDLPKASGRVSREHAFSLIEVLIVVAIMGLLSAVAYPSYQGYVLRSHRAMVQSEMQNILVRQEYYYVEHRQYAKLSELGYSADSVALDSDGLVVAAGAGRYDLSMRADPPAGQFVIEASATSAQLADTGCLVLTLNTSGDRTASGCW